MLKTGLGLPHALREVFSGVIIHEKRFGLILDLIQFFTDRNSLHRALYKCLTSAFIAQTNRHEEENQGKLKETIKNSIISAPSILNNTTLCTSQLWPELGQTRTFTVDKVTSASNATSDLRSEVLDLNPVTSNGINRVKKN